jgi:imidazoleglycerol-phosphate dehydratase
LKTSASLLGETVLKALGDRKGINRAGYFVMPMDETLAVAAIDLSGRPHAVVNLKVKVERWATCRPSSCTTSSTASRLAHGPTCISTCSTAGRAITTSRRVFKAFARALRVACARDARLRRCCRARKGCCDRAD